MAAIKFPLNNGNLQQRTTRGKQNIAPATTERGNPATGNDSLNLQVTAREFSEAGIPPQKIVVTKVTVRNQYFDFASFSDILVETAIDPIVENTAAEMGYRAALTANTLARTEFEAEATADTTIVISCTDNEFLSASLTRQAVMSLRGADVRPQTDGLFAGIIHPFAAFDLSRGRNLPNSVNHSLSKNRAKPTQVGMCRDCTGEAKSQEPVRTAWRHAELRGNTVATQKCGVTDCLNDNTAGGVIDILKYHKEGSEELMRGVQGYRVIDVAGARFIETTTASTFASFPSGTKTGYGTYVVGQDAVFSVSLGATEIPEQRNYQLIVRNWEPSVADPARIVGASCAYNFKYAAMRVPQSAALHPRFRLIKAEASIS